MRVSRQAPWAPVLVADAVVLLVAALLAQTLREVSPFLDAPPRPMPVSAAWHAMGWLLVLVVLGCYRRHLFGIGTEEYKRVFHSGVVAIAGLATLAYLLDLTLPRGFFGFFILLGTVGLLLERWVARRLIHRAFSRGVWGNRTLIVGPPSHVDEISAVLRREPWLGYQVIGALTPATAVNQTTASGIKVWGNPEDARSAAQELNADVVLIASGAYSSAARVREIVWELEDTPVQVAMVPNVMDFAPDRIKMRPVGGMPLVMLEASRWSKAVALSKRTFDVVVASVVLLAASPLLVAAALAVRLEDGGPVLFRQKRVGLDGRPFDCFKLRTMVVDAEERLAALKEETGFSGGLFKLEHDPRVTRVGRLLRKYSVDEVPQLFNVLRGEMSLVGPRPPLESEVLEYDKAAHRRLRVRPGMTGLWQVSGRSSLSATEAIRLDLYYVDNWSMMQDVSILMRTFKAVFRPDGAY